MACGVPKTSCRHHRSWYSGSICDVAPTTTVWASLKTEENVGPAKNETSRKPMTVPSASTTAVLKSVNDVARSQRSSTRKARS